MPRTRNRYRFATGRRCPLRPVLLRLRPGPADLHRDEVPQRRAGEGRREGGGHRLLQQDRGPRGIGLRHFQHDLVVRRRDRAALDPRLEQSRVDHRQRQHEGVGAGALDRQIEALGVAVTVRIPVDLVDAPALASDRDAAAALAGARESPAPAREVGIGLLEGPDPLLRCGQVEDQAVLLPRRGDETLGPCP